MKRYLKVITEYPGSTEEWGGRTFHYTSDSGRRSKSLSKDAKVVKSFVVDRRHRSGYEVHTVYDTAEIIVYNLATRRRITILFARPGQIARLFKGIGMTAPQELLDKAHENYTSGKNNI